MRILSLLLLCSLLFAAKLDAQVGLKVVYTSAESHSGGEEELHGSNYNSEFNIYMILEDDCVLDSVIINGSIFKVNEDYFEYTPKTVLRAMEMFTAHEGELAISSNLDFYDSIPQRRNTEDELYRIRNPLTILYTYKGVHYKHQIDKFDLSIHTDWK